LLSRRFKSALSSSEISESQLKTLVIARGLHPPWATGGVSYSRGIIASLFQTKENEISIISTIENHRLARISSPRPTDWNPITNFKNQADNYIQLHGSDTGRIKEKVVYEAKALHSKEKFDFVHVIYQGLTPSNLRFQSQGTKKAIIIKYIYGPAWSLPNAITTNLFYNFHPLIRLSDTRISFPTHYSASTYWMASNHKTLVVPPAIDTSLFQIRSPSDPRSTMNILEKSKTKFGIENIQTHSKIILYLGFLLEQRLPYRQVLKAFSRVISEPSMKDAYLLIIGRQNEDCYGEKKLAENIISFANATGISHNLGVALQELSDEEKTKIISESEVMFYPFTTSHLNPPVVDPPLAILESMASGKKVLCSPVLSTPQIIKDGSNGFLLPNLEEESISSALFTAIDGRSDIGTSARKTIIEMFSLEAVAEVLDSINEELLQTRPKERTKSH
jgi:glycosyltransferase involved in cell wall biosynthesis